MSVALVRLDREVLALDVGADGEVLRSYRVNFDVTIPGLPPPWVDLRSWEAILADLRPAP